jgi:hypothetical protein
MPDSGFPCADRSVVDWAGQARHPAGGLGIRRQGLDHLPVHVLSMQCTACGRSAWGQPDISGWRSLWQWEPGWDWLQQGVNQLGTQGGQDARDLPRILDGAQQRRIGGLGEVGQARHRRVLAGGRH